VVRIINFIELLCFVLLSTKLKNKRINKIKIFNNRLLKGKDMNFDIEYIFYYKYLSNRLKFNK